MFLSYVLEGREQVTKWLKATFGSEKCQMEGMQYILLALVYFGHYFLGIIDYWGSSHVAVSREQKG